jgi:hypothetical protein
LRHLVAFGGLVTPQSLQTVLSMRYLRASANLKGSLRDIRDSSQTPRRRGALKAMASPYFTFSYSNDGTLEGNQDRPPDRASRVTLKNSSESMGFNRISWIPRSKASMQSCIEG